MRLNFKKVYTYRYMKKIIFTSLFLLPLLHLHGSTRTLPAETNIYPSQKTTHSKYNKQNITSDDSISNNIRTSLKSNTSLSAEAKNVQISVNKKVVTLTGTVKTQSEKSKVETLAKRVSGVKSVINKLEIKKPPHSSPKTTLENQRVLNKPEESQASMDLFTDFLSREAEVLD